jgi:hypothetical protein
MAATVALSKFLPLVLPHVPGVPQFMATFNLRLSAIEFCKRTRCWRHVVSVLFDAATEAVVAPAYAAIHEFETALWNNETYLRPIQFSDVDEPSATAAAGSVPQYVTQAESNTVRVIPAADGTLALTLFLMPVNGSSFAADADGNMVDLYDVVPDFLYLQHAEAIAAGAIARLMSMPGKDWTNPQLAAVHAARFHDSATTHFSVSLRGQHRARPRVKLQTY